MALLFRNIGIAAPSPVRASQTSDIFFSGEPFLNLSDIRLVGFRIHRKIDQGIDRIVVAVLGNDGKEVPCEIADDFQKCGLTVIRNLILTPEYIPDSDLYVKA